MQFQVGSSYDLELKFSQVFLQRLTIALLHRNLWVHLCHYSYKTSFNLWPFQKVWISNYYYFFKLLNFRTKFSISRLVLDIKKYISSQGTIPFCMFCETHFLKKCIFCFPSKHQISTIAMEWFPDNHTLEMKVLKVFNDLYLGVHKNRASLWLCRSSEIFIR